MTADLPQGVELTALAMAQDRRAESARTDRLFDDPLAGTLLAAASETIDVAGLEWLDDGRTLGDFCPPMAGFVAFRTRYIDEQIQEAVSGGVRQVVVLAAGLDTRAYRLAWPDGTRVFELDLPNLLEFKQTVLAGGDARPGCRRVAIPADLRDDWTVPLAGAGFRRDEPTAWIVEGLLMYLPGTDADRVVTRTRDLSAPGSRLILDHAYPAAHSSAAFGFGRDTLQDNGSPLASAVAGPHGWLAGHGWAARVPDFTDLARRYDRPLPPVIDPGRPDSPIFWFACASR